MQLERQERRAVMERAALGGATAFFPMLYMAGYPSGANL
jgi:hypothetical protein